MDIAVYVELLYFNKLVPVILPVTALNSHLINLSYSFTSDCTDMALTWQTPYINVI